MQDKVYRLHFLPKYGENMKKCTYFQKWKNILKCNRKWRKEQVERIELEVNFSEYTLLYSFILRNHLNSFKTKLTQNRISILENGKQNVKYITLID